MESNFRMKNAGRFMVAGFLALSGLLEVGNQANAWMAYPRGPTPIYQPQGLPNPMWGPYSNPYQTNLNFYGMPWGQVPPAYFYPSLTPFPGIPPANYFMPHFPSPYGPGNYCPTCNPYSPIPILPQQSQNQWHIMS
jgi:hypothetical protein